MSAKKRLLEKEIIRIDKRLTKIIAVMEIDTITGIIEARKDASQIMQDHQGDYVTIAELIKPLAIKEKYFFKIAKQQNGMKLLDERVALERDRNELSNDLALIYAV